MTKRVGNGSCAPRPWNRLANVGMTFQRMIQTTAIAIRMTAIGYTSADRTADRSLTIFSM